MKESKRKAQVFVNGILAGILSEYKNDIGQRIVFQYDTEYLIFGSPIGSHLPLTPRAFEWNELPPFFENLASEGWLREVQSKKCNLDIEDTFGLLLENGEELIGALSILPHDRRY